MDAYKTCYWSSLDQNAKKKSADAETSASNTRTYIYAFQHQSLNNFPLSSSAARTQVMVPNVRPLMNVYLWVPSQ